jgi:AcrR family transcriptional regulator
MTSSADDEHGQLSLRERKRVRTRAAIYEAAMTLFDERPYADVTVDEICARAEVGRATFFRFYGAKAALLLEFNRRLAETARTSIEASGSASAPDKLRILAGVIADAWADSSPSMRAMAVEMLHRPETGVGGENLHVELIELVAGIVRDGVASGDLAGQMLSADFIAAILMAALAGCVSTWFDNPFADLRETLMHTIDLLLCGLRAG